MPDFENGIFGLIPEAEWLDTGFNVTRPNDPIDGLFGDEKTDNIVARWQTIASEYQIPVMAHFHGFDTEANTTFRVPVDTHNIEKGLIKVKINQSERLRELIRSGVRQDALYDYVLDDGFRLADQVITRTKVAKNELLATGKVTIKENNLDLTVDYGVPSANVGLTLTVSDTADVPGQIQDIVDKAADAIPYWLYTFLRSGNELGQTRFMVKTCKGLTGKYFRGYILDVESGNSASGVEAALDYLESLGSKSSAAASWMLTAASDLRQGML